MFEFQFDRYEHSTLLCALIHYGMHAADPSEVIRCMEKISPEPTQPWAESMAEARAKFSALNREAVRIELEMQDDAEVAAMREP